MNDSIGMATPMSISGLPALMVPENDGLKESKKLDTADGHSVAQHPNPLHGETEAVAKASEANSGTNNDPSEDQNRPASQQINQEQTDSPKKQSGLKPPRSGESKKPATTTTEYEPSQNFRESLEKGIPIECGKRSVFGFGLSDEQEDALFQYITNKTSKRPPGYEPDREALADCWGSPEPERDDEDSDPEEEPIPVVLGADLGQTLHEEKNEENEVDVASTESLYEGEGGVDLGSRSPGGVDAHLGEDIGNRCDDEAEADASDPTPVDDDLTHRALIMQKVKECYGLGVKTSLERVMRKDQQPGQSLASCNPIMTKIVGSPTASEISDEDGISNLWEDECMRYLERAPEFRARLQYEVRVILISPAFHVAGRTVTAFSRLYEKKFGRTVDTVGFSTAARLCRSMPHVVQRTLLIDEGRLRLVDTPKNHRIVAGIRSGLRRIIYDILRTHPGIDLDMIESLCDRVIGQPLNEVLSDHGYQSASVECLLRDMPDIVFLDERAAQTRVYLCNGAQDPALTDGILILRPPISLDAHLFGDSNQQFKRRSPSCHNSEDQALPDEDDDVTDPHMPKSPPGPRTGPNGMAPEELSDLRVLCAAESSSPYRDAALYSIEDMSPHVRLRFRLLLALHDDGHGIKVEDLPTVYEKMFGVALDLPSLGFDSLQELIDTWQDVLLVKSSAPGWVFPINTLENNRILNTITSGLRSAVFAILLARYPEGLQPLELVECLEETLSGKLWEILSSNGYIFKDMSKTGAALSKGGAEFQLAECSELRLLLKDMEDFVRLGSQEDGVLIVKLRDGEFPLLDLLDCEVSEETTTVDDVIPVPAIKSPPPGASKPVHGDTVIEGLLSDEEKFSSPSTSPLPVSEFTVATTPCPPNGSSSPSLRLKQETRMIFGSPDYMENGLTVDEFCSVYRERTGRSLQLGEFKSMEVLMHAMPDIVSFEVGSDGNDQMITLVQSRRNMRILSVAKVGLRQVLFWALLKNPGGVWAELLEGWYVDFAGWPLSSALASHGYDKPRRAPLQPVCEFLQDMADLLEVDEEDPKLYVWGGSYEDPILADASLLGMSVESIQYDPMNEENKNSRWHTSMIAKAAAQLRNKDFERASDEKTSVLPVLTSATKISNAEDSDADIQESSCAVLKCLATLDANEANCPKKNLVESMLNNPPTLCQS